MKRFIITVMLAAGFTLAAAATAAADPAPGGNNPAYVCAPGQTPADPPPCPGKD